MHALVNIALRAARDAASALAHASDRLDRVKIIDDRPGQFLTSADVDADKTVIYHLTKTHPDYSIHSRVSGKQTGKDDQPTWLVDPLLGNRNYARGYSQFALSIACRVNGRIEHCVIVNPITGEEFIASRGGGAQLNSRRIRVATQSDLSNALVGLDADEMEDSRLQAWIRLLQASGAGFRVTGCAALDVLGVACGRLDACTVAGYSELSLGGALLILQEAGGFVGTDTGSPDFKSARELIFGNQKTFREMVKLHK